METKSASARVDGALRPRPTDVILLGTDSPIGLSVVRDLGLGGFRTIGLGWSKGAIAGASRYCAEHHVRRQDEVELIAQLGALARRHPGACLIAVGESDLLLINRHREELERDMVVLTPSESSLEKVLDKAKTQAIAREVGIYIAQTYEPVSVEAAREVVAAFSYPVVLKWPDPHRVSGRLSELGIEMAKFEYAADSVELLARLGRYENVGEFPMVQEYCPGVGLGHMFLSVEGETLLEFQHERLHEWPPEGGSSSLCRSVPLTEHQDARARSRALIKALRWTGVSMVEYRYDRVTGRYAFMEINGRFWGSMPLAVHAGVRFASGLVSVCGPDQMLRDEGSHPYRVIDCCYMIPEIKRLLRILFEPHAIQDPNFRVRRVRSVLDFATSIANPRMTYYVLSLADPGPFFADMRNVATKVLRGVGTLVKGALGRR